ncbi:hypothetical protein [Pseudomonas sp. VE 196-7]|uniref:hypothetical protein n=1 Tax=Pseudomonas sp. VE 196-7 TaxID=2956726 RepID=UPI0021D4A326|nr:hypothetical protein [Pseudomonas sp. VE 196-7]MCU7217578.1 hypothetical protein [Pseudomonas sp. VE 196-7]
MPELSYDQKLIHYATAPKATAGPIRQIEGRRIVTYWCGKLRGDFVKSGADWKASTKEEAIESARRFREQCKTEAKAKGLLSA